MGLSHLRIQFLTLIALSLLLWHSWYIGADYQGHHVLLRCLSGSLEKVVEKGDLLYLLALRMPAALDVLFHFFPNFSPLLLDQVHVLLLVLFVMLSFELSLYRF